MSRPIHGADVYRALAHPVRRHLIELLNKRGGLTPGEMLGTLRVSPTSLSHHLRMLRDAHLVTQRRRNRERVYSVRLAAVRRMTEWGNTLLSES